MKENRKRSILKAISYRFFATLLTTAIVYAFTRKFLLSIGVGLIEATSKIVYYYMHERIWNRISWGKYKAKK